MKSNKIPAKFKGNDCNIRTIYYFRLNFRTFNKLLNTTLM